MKCPNCSNTKSLIFRCPCCLFEVCDDKSCSVDLYGGKLCKVCIARMGKVFDRIEREEGYVKAKEYVDAIKDLAKQVKLPVSVPTVVNNIDALSSNGKTLASESS